MENNFLDEKHSNINLRAFLVKRQPVIERILMWLTSFESTFWPTNNKLRVFCLIIFYRVSPDQIWSRLSRLWSDKSVALVHHHPPTWQLWLSLPLLLLHWLWKTRLIQTEREDIFLWERIQVTTNWNILGWDKDRARERKGVKGMERKIEREAKKEML